MDPAHRMLLEEAYHAMEDAGLTLEQLRGSQTAAFVGTLSSEYLMLKAISTNTNTQKKTTNFDFQHASPPSNSPHVLRGAYNGFASSRLSFAFDLRGKYKILKSLSFIVNFKKDRA